MALTVRPRHELAPGRGRDPVRHGPVLETVFEQVPYSSIAGTAQLHRRAARGQSLLRTGCCSARHVRRTRVACPLLIVIAATLVIGTAHPQQRGLSSAFARRPVALTGPSRSAISR